MDKYIYEDNTIFELGEGKAYYPVIHLDYHEVIGAYAKVRLSYLLEHNLEFLAKLADDDKFDDYFASYQKEIAGKEEHIASKFNIQGSMTKLMAREMLMYQDIS